MQYQIYIIIFLSLILLYNIYILYKIFIYLTNEPDYSLCSNTKKYNIALLKNNITNIETGDIILFSSYTYFPVFRIFGHNTFSHIGLVIQIQNKYYILEMTSFDVLNNKIYRHKCLFSLYDRVNQYSGNVFISKLKRPLTKAQKHKLYKLIKNDVQFLNPLELYINFLYNYNFKNKYTCSSYIYYILQEINLIDKNKKIKNMDIHPFMIDLCNNNLYNYPIELLSLSSNINKLYNKTIEYSQI